MVTANHPLIVHCSCGNRARVPVLYAFRWVRCPRCKVRSRVPDLGSNAFNCHIFRAGEEPRWDWEPRRPARAAEDESWFVKAVRRQPSSLAS